MKPTTKNKGVSKIFYPYFNTPSMYFYNNLDNVSDEQPNRWCGKIYIVARIEEVHTFSMRKYRLIFKSHAYLCIFLVFNDSLVLKFYIVDYDLM